MYYPVLQNKQAELDACQSFFSIPRTDCSPVVGIRPPADPGSAKRTVQRLKKWAAVSNYTPSLALYLDPDASAFLQTVLGEMTLDSNFRIAIDSENIATCKTAIEDFHAEFKNGAIIVIDCSTNPSDSDLQQVTRLQQSMPVDCILRLPNLNGQSVDVYAAFTHALLSQVRSAGIKNLVLAGGSYPESNAGFTEQAVRRVERVEALLYQRLAPQFPTLHYGDYGPLSPVATDADAKPQKITPAIRYTTANCWMVHRGTAGDKAGEIVAAGYKCLAAELVRTGYYSGPQFSVADAQLHRIAHSVAEAPRSPQGMRAIEIERHMAFVSADVASAFATEDSPVTPRAAG